MQVALSNSQGGIDQQSASFPSSSAKSTAAQHQPTNLWDNLRQEGLVTEARDAKIAGRHEGLSQAFQQLDIRSEGTEEAESNSQSGVLSADPQRQRAKESRILSSQTQLPDRQLAEVPGDFFLPATVWPGKVAKGCATLSSGLLTSFGILGSLSKVVLVYKVKLIDLSRALRKGKYI